MFRCLIGLLLMVWSSASFALEPLSLLLLRVLRDQIISSSAQAAIEGAQSGSERPGAAVLPPPPYALEDHKLRALIDEGFVHLTPTQREEVFASLKRALADPKNAHLRPMIIQELAQKASAVRQAHEQLNNLSDEDKKIIVSQARDEYASLPPAERSRMLQVLRSGIAPIPRDLNDMILAEFSQVAASTAAPAGQEK